MGGGQLWRPSTQVHHRPNPHVSSPLSLVSLPTDLPVLIAVVGGGVFLLFALGLIIFFVKKK